MFFFVTKKLETKKKVFFVTKKEIIFLCDQKNFVTQNKHIYRFFSS